MKKALQREDFSNKVKPHRFTRMLNSNFASELMKLFNKERVGWINSVTNDLERLAAASLPFRNVQTKSTTYL
jgi:hypothetical protein